MSDLRRVLVSVIIPVCNVEKYLSQGLDSVLGQALREIEIICVNDGSTDASAAILTKYAAKDARLKVITQPNAGAGAARNAGIEVAQGDYLYFCDPDDLMQPSMLQQLLAAICRDEADVAVCRFEQFDGTTGRTTFISSFSDGLRDLITSGRTFVRPEEVDCELFVMAGYTPWNKLFRRSFIEEKQLRFQKLRRTNDMLFVTMALANADRIAVVDDVLYRYRVGISSVTSNDVLAASFCDALLAVRQRLVEDGAYGRFKNSFILLAMRSFMYNIRRNRDFQVLEKIYPKMQETMRELIPTDGLGFGSQITLQMREVADAIRRSKGCREVAYRVRGFWPRMKNRIWTKLVKLRKLV